MKRTFIEILVILGVFAIAWYSRGEFAPKIVDNTVTDTVYVDKPYKVETFRKGDTVIPATITFYETEYEEISSIELVNDTIRVSTVGDNTYTYNSAFLTAYPTAPRFLGARKAGRNLTLSYQRVSGEVRSDTWNVGDKGYEVGLSEGKPQLRTFNDDKVSLGAEIEAGMLGSFNYLSPYLELSGKFGILGVDITGTANLNMKPFGMVGIKKQFN